MGGPFSAYQIAPSVYWVGAVDWSGREANGYLASQGTTYNSYLIIDEQIVLIDTVKAQFFQEMMTRIESVIDPTRISYIVINHAELDHTGCLPETVQVTKPERVLTSRLGVKTLMRHFPSLDCGLTDIEDGEIFTIGRDNLIFLETPMLHWPDSMFTLLEQAGILFTQDVFGLHLATARRYTDELDSDLVWREAAKFFANVLLPFSPMVRKSLQKINDLSLQFSLIAPAHGPIWRRDPTRIVERYWEWSKQKPALTVLVVYDTIWGSTHLLARAIAEGVIAEDVTVKLLPLKVTSRSDVALELLTAGALIVGSPTVNAGLHPAVADILTYLQGLKPQGLIGSCFGSYGWSGEAVAQVKERLTAMAVELAAEPIAVVYVPNEVDLHECFRLGSMVARRLRDLCGEQQS